MEVTTFIAEEKKSMVEEPDVWKQKIDELGLEGQQELIADGTQPIPFHHLTDLEMLILNTLFPRTCEIEKFKEEPIPMKALSAYALAKYEQFFEKVEIRYRPGSCDPVMIGIKENQRYLMAHWGEQAFDWPTLTAKARKWWIDTNRHAAENTARLYADIESLADRYFAGSWVYFV